MNSDGFNQEILQDLVSPVKVDVPDEIEPEEDFK